MTTPRVTVPVDVVAACKGEQEHFEAWAKSARYDMSEHPLHYIFTDPKTDAARMGWKAALAYVRDAAEPLSAAPAPEGGAVEATGAKAVIRNGKIVISIDVDALPLILSGSIALNAVAGTFKVTDAATFAKEVCYALNAEKEDGTTRVHMMFDSAFDHAIDKGAEGIEEISEDEFEAEAARLQAEAKSALAAREESPAEAGEVNLGWFAGFARKHGHHVQADWLDKYRAQPPAREDAQPVGRAVEMCGSAGKTSMGIFDAAVVPVGSSLYTHPAALQAEQGAK